MNIKTVGEYLIIESEENAKYWIKTANQGCPVDFESLPKEYPCLARLYRSSDECTSAEYTYLKDTEDMRNALLHTG